MKKKNPIQQLQSRFADVWPLSVMGMIGLVIVTSILWFQLGSFLPGMSQSEASLHQLITSDSIRLRDTFSSDAMYLPFTAGLYLLQTFNWTSIIALRSIGALFGLLSVLGVYLVLRKWHTPRVAVLVSALYATGAAFLHFARLADPSSAYLLLVLLIALAVYFRENTKPSLTITVLLLISLTSLFLPGMIWILVIGIIWQRKAISRLISSLPPGVIISGTIVSVLGIGLLIFSLYYDASAIRVWLGLPVEIPGISTFIKNVISIPVQLFWRGPSDPVVWIGISGLIDVFVSALFILGSYAYYFQRRLDRTKVLFGTMGLISVLVALGGPVPVFLLVPFVYIVAAAGMALMLQQWFTVFPRNPFARSIALLLMFSCVAFAIFYNTQHYFVAWPKSPATKAVFQQQIQ
ncbi:hypothetical protein BH23PAT2_BH23PAT2_01930 [soil metagenome]